MESKDVFKFVYDTRNLEISLFWQRSNYFLALNTALAVGFFNLKEQSYTLVFAVLGVIAAVLWLAASLGSKFWQARWERRLELLEQGYIENGELPRELNLFSANNKTLTDDAEEGLGMASRKGFQAILYKLALKKPSVSYCMILLAVSFVVAWIVVLILFLLSGKTQ
jgi:hypothetical protein